MKMKMAPAGTPSPTGPALTGTSFANYKRTWWRRVAPCLAFLAAFSTAMILLLVWSEAAALRRQAFDANMTRDYVLDSVSMDNPQLVAYIRQVHLKPTTHQDPLNANQTSVEKYVAMLSQGKREGIYAEYISRIAAISSTAWLESILNWRGVLILTEPKSFFEAQRSSRHPLSRVLHACLSTDTDTKEIKYHQESEVQVTKLGDGPNSLVSSDDGFPTTRLKCFPLYSVLLAYNATTLDYLSLDSPDAPDGQVLDTIPWDIIRISILSIRWGPHHSEAETKSFIDKMTSRRYKLVHTTDTACLMAVGVGTALAWTSPVLPQLYEESFWLVITKEQGSWVGSLLALGAIAGAVPSGPMADRLGRKKTLLLLTIPFLLSWAIIIFASKLWLIYLARFIVGIAVGASCVVIPTYISEIAETSTRGSLGAMFQLFLTVGILLAFILGAVMNYTAFAIVCAFIEIGFLASFVWMPESPVWLVNQGRKPEATIAMEVLRGDSYDPSEELREAQQEAEQAALRKSTIFDLIRNPAARKALLASLGSMFFQQLSGINAVIFYTVTIFKASGSSMPAEVASIIVAIVQMIMTGVAALIVDRAGRKPLLIFSSSVMLVSLVALGSYFNIKASGSDVSNLGWLPLTSMILYMISFSVGMGPIPWMLMAELFPAETKAVASGLAVMLNWFLVFVVTKSFPAMKEGLGADVTFWIFATIMAAGTAFTYFFIPETKGKTSQEIQEELQGNVRLKRTNA